MHGRREKRANEQKSRKFEREQPRIMVGKKELQSINKIEGKEKYVKKL